MTLLVVGVIVLPAGFLIVSHAYEVIHFYHSLDEMIKTGHLQSYLNRLTAIPVLKGIFEKFIQYVDLSQVNPFDFLLKKVQQIGVFLFHQTSNLLKSVSTFAASFFTLVDIYIKGIKSSE